MEPDPHAMSSAADRPPLEHARLTGAVGPGSPLGEEPVEIIDEIGSTNDELLQRIQQQPGTVHNLQCLLTEHQVAGHGRRERTWNSPRASAAVVSFAVLPEIPDGAGGYRSSGPGVVGPESLHWVPMILALAGRDGIRRVTGLPVSLKWPNDLLIGGKKTAGILGRAVTDPWGRICVVAGMGINCNIEAAELPFDNATTLMTEAGGPVDRTAVLAETIASFRSRMRVFAELGGNPEAEDPEGRTLLGELRAALGTLGRDVRVVRSETLPDLLGRAEDLAVDGSLLVRTEQGRVEKISVGDVVHLRPAAGTWAEQSGEASTGDSPEENGAA